MPDLSSSKAGHFTLALKGVRKGLRRCGPRAERLVRDVEEGKFRFVDLTRQSSKDGRPPQLFFLGLRLETSQCTLLLVFSRKISRLSATLSEMMGLFGK
jgi:hypothetical protein